MSDIVRATEDAFWIVGRITQLLNAAFEGENFALFHARAVLMGLRSTWKHVLLILSIWQEESEMAELLSRKGFQIGRIVEIASVTRAALPGDALILDLSADDLENAFAMLREHVTLTLDDQKIADAVAKARDRWSFSS